MSAETRRAAKQHFLTLTAAGIPWRDAAAQAELSLGRTAAYLLRRRFHQAGNAALDDHRHGHPSACGADIRAWLIQTCQADPQQPSRALQATIQTQFGRTISISQLNRVRATLGIAYQRPPKKA